MAIALFEPIKEVERLQKKMRGFMDVFPESLTIETGGFNPKINMAEDDSKIIIHAELPGVSKGDVKISIQDNILTIKGEKKTTTENKKLNFYRFESRYGSFSRSIEIPVDVDVNKIAAKFENGILNIELIKTAKEVKEKVIDIS